MESRSQLLASDFTPAHQIPSQFDPALNPVNESGNSQLAKILKHLRNGKTITAMEALAVFRCFNLKGRIYDLRRRGHTIITTMKHDATGKTYASYTLIPKGRARG